LFKTREINDELWMHVKFLWVLKVDQIPNMHLFTSNEQGITKCMYHIVLVAFKHIIQKVNFMSLNFDYVTTLGN
jgi:hypothetical protein